MFFYPNYLLKHIKTNLEGLIIPGTQMNHILEDFTHKMKGQPTKKRPVGF